MLAFSLILSQSCKQKEEYHAWNDPNVVQINKLAPHSLLIPYQDDSLALTGDLYTSSNVLSLNGMWKFKWVSKAEKASKNFYKSNYDVSKWDEIEVPSNWRTLGYDQNSQNPSTPPTINVDNPTGSYHTQFIIPANWKGKNIILRFEGVKSALKIWINGKEAGYSEGSSLPCEFNITPFLIEGENVLAARVFQWCNSSYLENNTLNAFSGITKDVFLYALDNIYINDITVNTDFDEEYKNAELKVDFDIKNISQQTIAPQKIKAVLLDANKQTVMEETIPLKDNIGPGASSNYTLLKLIEEPQSWSEENPYLYNLLITFIQNDNVKTIINQKIGFREVEIKDNILLLNGKPIDFRGTEFAEFSPDKGNVMTREEIIENLVEMKRNNVNTIMTKYGPHSSMFYDLCNEYGIYVWDQLNTSSKEDAAPLFTNSEWKDALLNNGLSMFYRDKNNPCVITWSLGNKGKTGDNIEALREEIKKRDNRPIHFSNHSLHNASTTIKASNFDIISIGNISPSALEVFIDSFPEKPIVLLDYLYSKGNALGGIADFWDVINKNKGLQGGFLSDWNMLALKEIKNDSLVTFIPIQEQENDDMSGLYYPDGLPTPAINELKFAYQPVVIKPLGLYSGVLSMTNKFSDINLKQLDAYWEIARDGKRVYGGKIYKMDIEPGSTGTVKLPYSSFAAAPGKEYFLNISIALRDSNNWADKGYEIAWAQYKLPFYSPRPESLPLEYMREIEVSESNENYIIRNKECTITINKENGSCTSYQYHDEELLKSGPEMNFWRPPTNLDRIEEIKYAAWKETGLDSLTIKVRYANIEKLNSKMLRIYFIKTYINANNTELFDVYNAYTVYGNGSMEINTKVVPTNYVGTLAKAGLQFTLPKTMNNIKWFGKGPFETYPDRSAAKVSVYEASIDQLFEHYLTPQENGNRTDVRWINITDSSKAGLIIQSYNLFNMSVSKYSDHTVANADNNDQLKVDNELTLHVDFEQTGVGKAFTGPDGKAPYVVYAKEMNYTIYLRPYIPSSTNLGYFMSRRLPGVAVRYPSIPVAETE